MLSHWHRDRICPGRFFAIKVVFISIARVLAAFDILPPVDEKGEPRMLQAEFTKDLVSYVKALHLSSQTLQTGYLTRLPPFFFEQSSRAIRVHCKTPIREVGDAYCGGVGEILIKYTYLRVFIFHLCVLYSCFPSISAYVANRIVIVLFLFNLPPLLR